MVLDGTATGVMKDLPAYDRPSLIVESAKDTEKFQYVNSSQKVCNFLGSIFKAASYAFSLDRFKVRIPDQTTCYNLFKCIGPSQTSNLASTYSALLMSWNVLFTPNSAQLLYNRVGHKCRPLEQVQPVEIEFGIGHTQLRRAFGTFMRELYSSSIPHVVMQTEQDALLCVEMVMAFERF